jgi:hypothetical protein
MKKQTAVEWLENQLNDVKYNPLEKNGYSNALAKLYVQAKEMEKEQIIDAWMEMHGIAFRERGEKYYKKTYQK